jgi:hypothetical protein
MVYALRSTLCALCSVLYALCSVLCALCSVLCALCSMLYALCPVPCALCSMLLPLHPSTLYALRSTFYILHYTLHAPRSTLHPLHSLPNNSKFLSSFSNFGTVLGSDHKRRMYCGRGQYSEGTVCSLNFFAQSMWLSNRPVVHHLPAWFDQWRCRLHGTSSFIEWIEKYYKSRFAWMFNLTWMSNTAADERAGAYERASNLAEVYMLYVVCCMFYALCTMLYSFRL